MTRLQTLEFLAALPLKELRRRQDLNEIAAHIACTQGNDAAIKRIGDQRTDLFHAVEIKEFGACARCIAGVVHTHTGNGVN